MFILLQIAGTQLNGTQHVHTHTVFERFFPHIDNNSCIVRNTPGYGSQTLIYFKYCIRLQFGKKNLYADHLIIFLIKY